MGFRVDVTMPDLAGMTAMLENESLHRQGLMVAAVDPTIKLMEEKLKPHRRANPSAVDTIGSAVAPSRLGYIEILVGAIGGRGFVLWFLNYGTRHQRAQPWLEPVRDQVVPGVTERLAAYLRSNK